MDPYAHYAASEMVTRIATKVCGFFTAIIHVFVKLVCIVPIPYSDMELFMVIYVCSIHANNLVLMNKSVWNPSQTYIATKNKTIKTILQLQIAATVIKQFFNYGHEPGKRDCRILEVKIPMGKG